MLKIIILMIFCCRLKKNDSGAIRFIGTKVRIKNETCVPVSDTSLGGNMWQSADSRSGQKGSDLCWRQVAPPDDCSIYHNVSIFWINQKFFLSSSCTCCCTVYIFRQFCKRLRSRRNKLYVLNVITQLLIWFQAAFFIYLKIISHFLLIIDKN